MFNTVIFYISQRFHLLIMFTEKNGTTSNDEDRKEF